MRQQAITREDKLRAEIDRLRSGLQAVQDLIDDSYGVTWSHLDGIPRPSDVVPWDALFAGGKYENWLAAYSKAWRGE